MIKEPFMLLSIVNMKLRDFYKDLDSLCECEDFSKQELVEILESISYKYDSSLNQFISE